MTNNIKALRFDVDPAWKRETSAPLEAGRRGRLSRYLPVAELPPLGAG